MPAARRGGGQRRQLAGHPQMPQQGHPAGETDDHVLGAAFHGPVMRRPCNRRANSAGVNGATMGGKSTQTRRILRPGNLSACKPRTTVSTSGNSGMAGKKNAPARLLTRPAHKVKK